MNTIIKISTPRNSTTLMAGILLLVVMATSSLKAETGTRNNLVTVSWLAQYLGDTNIILLDASPGQVYATKHITGAINYDIFTYGVKELPVAEIQKRYQAWGISVGKKIVIYDQGGTHLATRLLYALDYYGYPTKDLFIVDGGLYQWQQAGLAVTSEPTPTPPKGSFEIQTINKDVRVDLPEFLAASGDATNNILLEALDANWHYGTHNFFGRPGHVPNAILLPVDDFYNDDKTFKSNETIKKQLAYWSIDPGKNVLSHCGGGIAASVPYFALKFLLGYENVKLFPGSLLEWTSDQRELPLWTYDEPYLMRDAAWLQGWGGKMMRMYGMTNVSFVDVRPASAFAEGHLQYAVNLPTTAIQSHSNHSLELAAVLSQAVVDANHEAVIISGGGLTKEAALAFVALEKLGQQKISLYMDDADKWKQLGFTVVKDTMQTRSVKGSKDLSQKTTRDAANLHANINISSIKSTEGTFEKIYIASGANVPSRLPEGKMVHLPYTDILNTDGTPKAAKDIWNILFKAGIPRYAELVCLSDDMGEAAVNYFILKLMGFRDIKLMEKE